VEVRLYERDGGIHGSSAKHKDHDPGEEQPAHPIQGDHPSSGRNMLSFQSVLVPHIERVSDDSSEHDRCCRRGEPLGEERSDPNGAARTDPDDSTRCRSRVDSDRDVDGGAGQRDSGADGDGDFVRSRQLDRPQHDRGSRTL
jgi:hypothetical protein